MQLGAKMKRTSFKRKGTWKGFGARRKPMRDWRQKHPKKTRARVKEDLFEVVSLIVRLRDGRCVICLETDRQKLTCGHFYKRRWLGTAFDLRNNNALCKTCNERDNYNQMPYLTYMVKHYGEDVISELFELRNSKRHIPTSELEDLLVTLKHQLEEMWTCLK